MRLNSEDAKTRRLKIRRTRPLPPPEDIPCPVNPTLRCFTCLFAPSRLRCSIACRRSQPRQFSRVGARTSGAVSGSVSAGQGVVRCLSFCCREPISLTITSTLSNLAKPLGG